MVERHPFPVVTPEEAGVPAAAVAAFLQRLAEERLCLHAVLMIRDGKLFAEGYGKPYAAGDQHRVYSVSKSFTALGIGLLYGEGRLALDDPIGRFFPEKMPSVPHPYLERATIRDMLMMAAPQDHGDYAGAGPDWVTNFLRIPASHLPGGAFSYNTGCSVLLSAVIERLSGQKMLDYMRPRLLDPIGFSEDAWCIQMPCGVSWGGSGVVCTPRDVAKVALLCLRHGVHEGRRLIPGDFIDEATSRMIDSSVEPEHPEFQQGYGYQIWRTRHNGFAFRGLGSQLAVVLPDHGFVLVTTGDTQGQRGADESILMALWEEILPHLGAVPRPASPESSGLPTLMSGMGLRPAQGVAFSPTARRVHGKRYRMEGNAMGITDVRFEFSGNAGIMRYTNARGACALSFGLGHYEEQPFSQGEDSRRRIGTPSGAGYRTFASAAWSDAITLVLQVYLADDHLGNMRISAHFSGEEITLHARKTADGFLHEYAGFASGRAAV